MTPIKVHHNTYTSISEAWRETGKIAPLITIRWRLKNGWPPHVAFHTPVVKPEHRRTFKDVRDVFE